MIAPTDNFVGRRDELERLRSAFEQATDRRGRIVMLAGEPGIGKTRIAQELADHGSHLGAIVLWGRCHEEVGAPPYWPWVQVIRTILRDAAARGLLSELGGGASDLTDIVPEVRDLLPGLEPSAELRDPAEARWRMFESIRGFIARLCEHEPVLILLDDLHWADAPSLRLLEFLVHELADSRLLLVGTYRQTELSRRHPLSDTLGGLVRAPHVARIQLAGLSAEEVSDFIAAASGITPPAWLASALHTQTEGNPLFLREIVRFLEQQGVLRRDRATPLTALPPTIRIPEGVREVIGRRLNLLSASCNEVLAVAAVVGRDFSDDVLIHIAASQGDERPIDALDEALAANVIEEISDGHYQFTHNLIRMTLYDELRPARRRQLHRAAGAAIEGLRRADLDASLPELARHFHAAGDTRRAIEYATRAGQRADAVLAFEDAMQFYQAALDDAEQAEPDELTRCRLLLWLGEALRKANEYPRALEILHDAAEVATALSEAELSAQAALAYEQVSWRGARQGAVRPAFLLERALRQLPETNTVLRAHVAGALARALVYTGTPAEARAQGARAIAMARRLGDPGALATSLVYMFDFIWEPEHTDELIGYATEMLAAAERAGNMEIVGLAYAWRLFLYLECGDIRAVEADLDALTRVDVRIRQPTYSIAMISFHTMLAQMRGDLVEAERRIRQAMQLQRSVLDLPHYDPLSVMIFTLRREQGRLRELRPVLSSFLQRQSVATIWLPGLALMHAEIGQLDGARAAFERLAADDFAGLVRDGRWCFCMVYLSEVCAMLGDVARAATLYGMLQSYTGRNLVMGGGVACCGSADRYLGLLATTMSRWPDAMQHFEAALAMNARIAAHAPLAHTRHDYATMLLARGAPGDRDHAAELLRRSLESAHTLGMRALEERAAARLAQLGPSPSASNAAEELTSRETEVLKLIAMGRGNADIATVLEISLNTVATHVRNILAKTGCANRTEAAAYAIRHNLAQAHHS